MALTEEELKRKKELEEKIGAIGLFLPLMITPFYSAIYGEKGAKRRFDRVVGRLEELVDEYNRILQKEREAI
jgi:hypothetical protein